MIRVLYYSFWVWLLFFPLVTINAASLYIDPAMSDLYSGDSMTYSVRLDVDERAGECINVVSAVIAYEGDIDPVDVSVGESIFSLWVERPKINKKDKTISFAGGMPNGYCGRVPGDPRLTNTIAKLVFQVPGFRVGGEEKSNEAKIYIVEDSTTIYNNDAVGSVAPLSTYPALITLHDELGKNIQNDWRETVKADQTPPEDFSITLARDELAFSGKYYIVFNTTDKQTGIARYQVMEEPIGSVWSFDWGRADAPWITAESPYVLSDQTLNSTIYVRAVDKNGNEYIAKYVPTEAERGLAPADKTLSTLLIFMLAVLVLVIGGVFAWIFWRRRLLAKRSGASAAEAQGHDGNE